MSDPAIPLVHGKTNHKLVGTKLLYSVSCFLSIGVSSLDHTLINQPSASQLGNMVAVLEIGAFITSLCAAHIADNYGRRMTLRIGAIIFTIGGAFQTFCIGYNTMLLGRITSGFGVGMLSMVVPIYQSEISPADHRGLLGSVEFTGNIIGYASSVWIDYACSFFQSDLSWRVPLSVQCIGGLVLFFGSFITPESPRYLVDSDQEVEGLAVIADFQGKALDHPDVVAEYKEIRDAVLEDRAVGDRSYKALWRRYKGRVLIAMSSQLFAQLNGINVISYYAPLVFEQAGWIGRDAILMTGINSLFYVASSLPPWYLMDRAGRRPILLSGAVAMAIALTATGWWIYIDQAITPNAVVICVVIYNAAFGMSWGPVPWLYPPEIMPLAFRAKGVSLSTATNWISNWWVGVSTPVFQELIGWRLYPMHAFFCVLSFILVYFLYPETRGVPLEEMDKLFGDEIVDDDDDDEEGESGGEDEDESETSSLVGSSRRRRSNSTSLPTSRKPSPFPGTSNGPSNGGVIGRFMNSVEGVLGGSKKRRSSMRGLNTRQGRRVQEAEEFERLPGVEEDGVDVGDVELGLGEGLLARRTTPGVEPRD
ncbi:hypothetical protein IAT38_008275 [Cryptococcus sp. DSM 104549]